MPLLIGSKAWRSRYGSQGGQRHESGATPRVAVCANDELANEYRQQLVADLAPEFPGREAHALVAALSIMFATSMTPDPAQQSDQASILNEIMSRWPKTFHVRRLKGSVDSVHTLDRDEVSALRRLKADSTSPFVFVSERGGPLSPDMIARIVERAGQAAKLGFHVHPHMLRHATGYALANEGTDTRLIQDFLGHASIANTVRYTKLAPGRLAAVRVR